MKNSLIYKLCYYRFGEVRTKADKGPGYDTVRNAEIGMKDFDLKYFREAYSSNRWLVRIYEVLPIPNRGPKYPKRAEEAGKSAIPQLPSEDGVQKASTLKVMKRPKI